MSEEKDRGISDRSLAGLRCVYSSFFGWLCRESLIKTNPVNNIGTIKYRDEVRLPFSDVEFERLKRACRTKRDIAVIQFLNTTGARIGEVVALNRADIDMTGRKAKVLGKGNKERTVFFDDVTADVLKDYLESRTDSDPALFIGKRGRFEAGGFRVLLNQIGERAHVENVHPHRFRRTLATKLAKQGMPVQNIAAILGHSNINTTMKYVFMDTTSVENEYRRYI